MKPAGEHPRIAQLVARPHMFSKLLDTEIPQALHLSGPKPPP